MVILRLRKNFGVFLQTYFCLSAFPNGSIASLIQVEFLLYSYLFLSYIPCAYVLERVLASETVFRMFGVFCLFFFFFNKIYPKYENSFEYSSTDTSSLQSGLLNGMIRGLQKEMLEISVWNTGSETSKYSRVE